MCNRKENFEKWHFLACGVVFSRILTFCLSPHDFSKRLKIWNFDKIKKVSSRRGNLQQKKKNWKKSFFRPLGRFLLRASPFSFCLGWPRFLLLARGSFRSWQGIMMVGVFVCYLFVVCFFVVVTLPLHDLSERLKILNFWLYGHLFVFDRSTLFLHWIVVPLDSKLYCTEGFC